LANSELAKAPCAPSTLDILARFSAPSRVKPHENSNLYSKMRVYDGESLKDTDPRAKSVQEYRDTAGVDAGKDGISTRFAFKVLSDTFNFDTQEVAADVPAHAEIEQRKVCLLETGSPLIVAVLLDQILPYAPVLSFLAVSAGALIALLTFLNHRRVQRASDIAYLRSLLQAARADGVFRLVREVVQVTEADPKALLGEPGVSQKADRVLNILCGITCILNSPKMWKIVLLGSEFGDLQIFLKNTSEYVWAVRTTRFGVTEGEQWYNGNRHRAARELYTALGIKLSGIDRRGCLVL
jgi:hypothetical protein